MGKISAESNAPNHRWLQSAALILALALVIARCLTAEYLRDPSQVMPGSPAAPRGVGAAIGIMMDLASCIPALLILLDQALSSSRRRVGPAPALFLVFAALAFISVAWASDKYSCALGAAHLIAAGALMWAMAQVVSDWQSAASVAATCLGLLLCYLAQGIYYETVDLPDLRDRWVNDIAGTRTNVLSQHNWTEGSFPAKQFALKILHGDLATFFSSANTYAAMLSLLAVIVAGIFLSSPRKPKNLALLVLLIPLFWLLWLTQCKAAFVILFLAAIILCGIRLASPITKQLHRNIYMLGIVFFLIAGACITGYGLRHGNLHNASLDFRWRYWVAATKIFCQHPILGVGWNTFGEHYLAVRLPTASEEIKDPHNVLVRVITELGLIGILIFIPFLLLSWWRSSKPTMPPATEQGIITARSLMIAMVLAMAINTLISIDFSQISAYIFIEVMRRFLFLALLLIAVIFVLDINRKTLEGAPMRWLPAAIAVALGLFLLHNLIDFALFDPSPGPLMLFALLTGTAIGIRTEHSSPAKFVWTKLSVCTILVLIGTGIAVPIVAADSDIQQADDLVRDDRTGQAIPLYADAVRLVPYNSEYPLRQAEAMLYNNSSRAEIEAAIDAAIMADPRFVDAYLLRARYLQRLSNPDASAIIDAYNHALSLDPNEVSIRLELADFEKNIGESKQAAAEYRQALWFNDQFPPEEAKRLPPEQVEHIKQTIQQLDPDSPAHN